MGQFLEPASVYNKSLSTQSVTNHGVPKNQSQQNSMHQIDSLKEKSKLFFAKADTIRQNCFVLILSFQTQSKILDGVETGLLPSGFAKQPSSQRWRFRHLIHFYSTLLAYLHPWFWIKMPKQKGEESESFAKSGHQKLQHLYTQGGAADGSVGNLVKASNLSVSKLRQVLHSKTAHTKINPATKFKRLNSFARFKNELCCMDLAYVDTLAKDDNSGKYIYQSVKTCLKELLIRKNWKQRTRKKLFVPF